MAFELRKFLAPGPICLGFALILSILVAISLPSFDAMDITRVHWSNAISLKGLTIDELRFGIWGGCVELSGSSKLNCPEAGLGYSASIIEASVNPDGSGATEETITITGSWTRGLILHPIATAFILIAFALSISDHTFLTVLASLSSFLAALITFLAFVVDIVLYVHVKSKLGSSSPGNGDVVTAPGFWLTFVTLILTLVGGCVVFIHHRRAAGNDIEMFSRFRK